MVPAAMLPSATKSAVVRATGGSRRGAGTLPATGAVATANDVRAHVRTALVLKMRHGVRDDGNRRLLDDRAGIADVLRATRGRVRQIEQRAAGRLRRRLAG
jgi:hypothetical protein